MKKTRGDVTRIFEHVSERKLVSEGPDGYTTHKKLGIFGFPMMYMENVIGSCYNAIS